MITLSVLDCVLYVCACASYGYLNIWHVRDVIFPPKNRLMKQNPEGL